MLRRGSLALATERTRLVFDVRPLIALEPIHTLYMLTSLMLFSYVGIIHDTHCPIILTSTQSWPLKPVLSPTFRLPGFGAVFPFDEPTIG